MDKNIIGIFRYDNIYKEKEKREQAYYINTTMAKTHRI